MPFATTLLPILAVAAITLPNSDDEAFATRVLQESALNGTVMADLLLGPDGVVEACEVVYDGGMRRNAVRVCEVAMGLKAGQPATGPDGRPAHGIATFDVEIRPEGSNAASPLRPAELEVTVQSLPARFGSRMRVPVVAYVSDGGALLECGPAEGAPANYGALACGQLGEVDLPVKRNRAGTAVAYVHGMAVDFMIEAAAPVPR